MIMNIPKYLCRQASHDKVRFSEIRHGGRLSPSEGKGLLLDLLGFINERMETLLFFQRLVYHQVDKGIFWGKKIHHAEKVFPMYPR